MTSNERAYAIADRCRQGMGLWTGDLVRLIGNAIDDAVKDAVKAAIEEERNRAALVAERFYTYSEIGRRIGLAIRAGQGEKIQQDIIARAVEEEREACAKIADDLARRTREEWEENPLLSLRGTENCEAIRDAIRARGEKR